MLSSAGTACGQENTARDLPYERMFARLEQLIGDNHRLAQQWRETSTLPRRPSSAFALSSRHH
jgi:hypothetical protein